MEFTWWGSEIKISLMNFLKFDPQIFTLKHVTVHYLYCLTFYYNLAK